MKRKIFRWLKVAVLLYCSIGIAIYYLQDHFLLHPKKLPSNYTFHFTNKFEEINIPFNEKDTMNVIKFLSLKNERKGIVLYFHGNKENVEHYAQCVLPFTKNGYEVWMEDYPTFGKSTGDISEKKLYQQAEQLKKMADSKIGSDSIIIYGKSLGTGIAAYVANYSTSKILLLETPYYSIPSLYNSYTFIYPTKAMANYQLPTNKYLEMVLCPIIIFHGTDDVVIPLRESFKLKPLLKTGDQFITIEGGTHHNVNISKKYCDVIDSILKK